MNPTPGSPTLFFTHATVTLDKTRPMIDGWGQWNSVGALFLHELGHAVGLAPVTDPHQVMYPIVPVATDYQNGDREGLWMVGSHWGC